MWSKKFLIIAIVVTIAACLINLAEAYFWEVLPIATDVDEDRWSPGVTKRGYGVILRTRYDFSENDWVDYPIVEMRFSFFSLIIDFVFTYFYVVMGWALLGIGKEAVKDVTNFGKEDES